MRQDINEFVNFDYEEEDKPRRPKRNYNKEKCSLCGEPLKKKEKKNGLCWPCFIDEKE